MGLEFKDYYATLGVARTATDDELKKAFRALARKYHPDVAKDKKAAEEKFKEINEAYEVLSHPENRKKYDTLGANWKQGAGFQPPPGWEQQFGGTGARGQTRRGRTPAGEEFQFGGTGFSDFFEQFFSGRRSAGGTFTPEDFEFAGDGERVSRGADAAGDLAVSLHEALHGSVRAVSLRRNDPRTGETVTETFKVRIPAGVQEGQRIRVAGKGGAGQGGAGAGDLFLTVRLSAHSDFQARGADLVTELELAPWEAVLGATVPVPTLEGAVTLRIPPGTNTGHQLRVRGRGLPKGGSQERGDLFVTVSVRLPSTLSDEERDLWEQLAKVSSFNPRGGP